MTENAVTAVASGSVYATDITALGRTFRLVSRRPETRERLSRDWSRCVRQEHDDDAIDLTIDDVDGPVEPRDLYFLTSEVTRQAIEARAGELLLLHACGVATADGEVLALVGPSGAGKSTAARALCRGDFGYVTDETVAVDDRGAVLPYPKPLSLRDASTGVTKAQHGPDDLGLRHPPDDLRMGAVVLLDRQMTDQPPSLRPLPLTDAILDLVPQTSALPSMARPLQRLCSLLTEAGGARRLTFTQIDDAADLLASATTAPRAVQDWAPLVGADAVRDTKAWSIRDGRVHPMPFVDAVRVEDEGLVLAGRIPLRLSGIGLTIWRESHRGPTFGELEDAVVAAHGPHPDAARLVLEAVETLREAGAIGFGRPRTVASLLTSAPRPSPDRPRNVCAGT